MKILNIQARQILDSLGIPTLEVKLTLANGLAALSSVPSGASTGRNEAVELRDGEKTWGGKSVLQAVKNVNEEIFSKLAGEDVTDQRKIDQLMIDLDGTKNKQRLGANAILGVSMAVCKAAATFGNIPLFTYIGSLMNNQQFITPLPLILMLEGGKHGNFVTDIQEFMIIPTENRFDSFASTLEAGIKIFYCLQEILKEKGYSTGLGFEGAFCPQELSSNEEALQLLTQGIEKAGLIPGQDFSIALDFASSQFYQSGKYILKSEDGKTYQPKDWTDKIASWVNDYPIFSLEDAHQEDLWQEWTDLTDQLGQTHQVVGDDLVTTNIQRIKQAIDTKAINAVLIKPNQIGTVTETLEAITLTKQAGWPSIISHRAGETNDDFIADLCVGTGSEQCKFGGLNRGERIAKYNRLLEIEEQLRSSSVF
ncbi:phosphopyruvate hydratase [Candidatus Daviesbacteria bacterium RIFCSPHIGHO2_01_FULL_44_29]|uniref:Enolase n=1 Tax=Candidatus Daviesbacteria bacterium RIFCSPHIGHO2_02_FULL_43_12 TaxID=1797776 RepID=A0A1F5KHF9_9BACT|nr:MAG: phosphopyruvate hydratase [Candidatus Daviesbacteria bacterium RIFCSPHIGHO2_01_FULL_44_29]OGE39371.1 MAG: phosphopyruvate hydratase [Candidatus Daviesbacteria bacterium RIFCSPHIGHO2_12_FULL_47_45]OGE40250.1 MAG: phosphopyruvate hydratase [Candidatus Daviesbacteria bacterium RIFCSPHIGHO2_02_FULL_43_12]OGE69049.1 MAG: phosphopyruvate hydratase [Candidatus Daviesbacteria bacterium RIFCSPLOWO2_01_FULL_43_15]